MTNTAVVSMGRQRTARKPRVLLVVDVQNMQHPAIRLDYVNLIEFCRSMGKLVSAAAFVTDSTDPFRINFQLMLRQNSYQIMRIRPVFNASGEMKCNADIMLAFWLGREIEKHRLGRGDIVVLCTGDGDFTQIAEWLRARDIRVVVVAFGSCTSSHQQIVASEFHPIEETPILQQKKEETPILQHKKPVSAA